MDFLDKIKVKIDEYVKNREGSGSSAGNFFKSAKNRMGIGTPERNATDTYESGMKIVPECISANENEIPVKQYNVAVLRNIFKFERAEGRIQVTNKRVIFRAAGRSVGGRTTVQHEYAINEIAGIEARNNFKFSFMYFLFAIFIIVLSFYVIYRPSITGIISPLNSHSYRVSRIMNPNHLEKYYQDERIAVSQKRQAELNLSEARQRVRAAYEAEEKAGMDVRNGIQRTRRVQSGTNWWGEPQYTTETYRDRSAQGLREAQNQLNTAIGERERFQAAEWDADEKFTAAEENEARMIKKMISAVNTWKVLMTIWGIILGIGGLLFFFILNKKFGLKLFLLMVSIFGFALSLAASESVIFYFFIGLSVITALVCVFLFCFRPNFVMSIKNKSGTVEGPVDIRRNTIFTRNNEKGTGFDEVIPTEEAERAVREIGALIGDIQKLGDLGLEKWAKQ